jgi:hypothetical protein
VSDRQEGVSQIESTLRYAQKSGENMDPVLRQEYLAMAPVDRRAALIQIKQDRAADPSLPGLEITDRDGDVSVKSDTTRSWATQGKEQINNVQANIREDASSVEDFGKQLKHATVDQFNTWRKLVPGQN